ncbi:MAG: hypothetical protein LCH93_13800 [Proteobacteria bacterium]|nr:hypothetical protein [Pseudomonadota bacterium]
MAHGKNGKLTIGVNAVVAGVTNWNRSVKSDTVETGAMGEGDDKQYEAGRRETTFDVQFNYVAADANGQDVIVAGTVLTFKLYPLGDGTAGNKYFGGSGIVETVTLTGPLDGKITGSATFRQSGAATDGAVPNP